MAEFTIEDWKTLCMDLRTEVMEWRRRALDYEMRWLEERQVRMDLQREKNEKGQANE